MKNQLKNPLILVLLLLFLGPIKSYGGELLEGRFGVGDTTDKINYKEFALAGTFNERNLFWPYLNESSKAHSFGLEFYKRDQKGPSFKSKFHRLRGEYSLFLKERHKVSFGGGFFQIDEVGFPEKRNKGLFDTEVASLWSESFISRFFLGTGSAVGEIFQTGQGLRDMDQVRYGTDLQYTFYKNMITARLLYIRNNLENDISRNFMDSEIMVALMKYPHWIRVGIGYHTMDYNKNTITYWSPLDFYAWGPRVDLSYVFNEKIQVYFGGNYSWFEENKTFSGGGYYLRTGMRYGLREDFNIDASYERNESIQNNNSWVGKAFLLNLNYFL
ncbi:MAG: hypothetical protein NXH75_15080 [Halobacteriovoraceae bacterium]|nr:hypothetical protein [Halobacteriovoraceae bacterium]